MVIVKIKTQFQKRCLNTEKYWTKGENEIYGIRRR